MFKTKNLAIVVAFLGVVVLVTGAVFIALAIQKNDYITGALRDQKITLGLSQTQINQGQLVDTAQTAQVAANTLGEHLKSIAPTYNDLMAKNANGRYDPTNPNDLSYTQGLNMENSLDIAVLGFGVVQLALGVGIILVIIGLAAGGAGLSMYKLAQKEAEAAVPATARAAVAYQTK